jgi:hypothetical protein
MALGAVQNNREVLTNISASPNMAEATRSHGSFRGQTVSYKDGAETSKIAMASKGQHRSEAAKTDIASLSLRTLRQGQGATLKATPRIVDYFDKLPNMPEMSALQNLVELLQSFEAQLTPPPDAQAQTTADALENDAALQQTPEQLAERRERAIGEKGAQSGGDGQQGGGDGRETPGDDARKDVLNRIFAALQQTDPDITHQFATLDVLREHFAEIGASAEFQEALADAARAFDQPELMRDIRAGFAAAQIAKANAETLETSPAVVREAYRQMLRELKNYGQLFDTLARFDLLKKLDAAVETFRTAAARDLAGLGPSPDRAFLQMLMAELGKLKRIVTVLQLSEEAIAKMRRLVAPAERKLLEPADQAAIGVASRVLNFSAKPNVGLNDAKALLAPLDAASLMSQVAFANALRIFHSWLPDDILPSPQARQQQVTTLAALQSNLVAAEEAEFASGGGSKPG